MRDSESYINLNPAAAERKTVNEEIAKAQSHRDMQPTA